MSGSSAPVLTPVLAQRIAGETTAIIEFNVLITDINGTVIGSGDTSRLGSFHEASLEVMRTRRPKAHTEAEAERLHGVRPGITLPIVLDDLPVGTVGITGLPARVRQFGLVVKRQTEILLAESVRQHSQLLRERALEDLVRDIAHFDPGVVAAELLRYRAHELGYDLDRPRVAVLIEIASEVLAVEGLGHPFAVLRTIRDTFSAAQDVVAATPSGAYAVLAGAADVRGVLERCRQVVEDIARRNHVAARAGVGDPATTVPGLRDSYADAGAALLLGARTGAAEPVHTIADLRLHQVLAAVAQQTRSRFVDVTVSPLRAAPDWPVLRDTVVAWCESGFNLVRAAAALHIHRNTMVYRLDKITDLLDRPIRDPNIALAAYLACVADTLAGP